MRAPLSIRDRLECAIEKAIDRGLANAEIEHAIALLDELDGDVDREDGGDDEPTLGWLEPRGLGLGGGVFAGYTPSDGDGLEYDPSDNEPSLGWSAPGGVVPAWPGANPTDYD